MKIQYSTTEKVRLPTARRLIFLVPCVDLDEVALGRQAWDMALSQHSELLFVTVVKDFDQDLRALHLMARLFSVTQDARIKVETSVLYGLSWLKAVRQVLRPEDVIVSLSGHRIPYRLLWQRPLPDWLAEQLQVPVVELDSRAIFRPAGNGRSINAKHSRKNNLR